MPDETSIQGVQVPEQNASFTAAAEGALAAEVALSAGERFWVEYQLTSSAILTTGVAVTGASSGGDLEIKEVILRTDGTGLAGGTDFELQANDADGAAVFLSTVVSGLGANATVSLDDATVTKQATVLESGKAITAVSTVANCTGAGVVKIAIQFERLANGATVAAA